MRILLIMATLLSLMFASEVQNELAEQKRVLAAKHDYMVKKPAAEREKHTSSSYKFSKEELEMEEAISQPSGPVINEDKVDPQVKQAAKEDDDESN